MAEGSLQETAHPKHVKSVYDLSNITKLFAVLSYVHLELLSCKTLTFTYSETQFVRAFSSSEDTNSSGRSLCKSVDAVSPHQVPIYRDLALLHKGDDQI